MWPKTRLGYVAQNHHPAMTLSWPQHHLCSGTGSHCQGTQPRKMYLMIL